MNMHASLALLLVLGIPWSGQGKEVISSGSDGVVAWKLQAKSDKRQFPCRIDAPDSVLCEVLYQTHTGVWGRWVNEARCVFTYSYDKEEYITEQIDQCWHRYQAVWVNSARTVAVQDLARLRIDTASYKWYGSSWDRDVRRLYTYNSSRDLIEMLRQVGMGNSWINTERTTYGYDVTQNTTAILKQDWSDTGWVNSVNTSNTYDGERGITQSVVRRWSDAKWVDSSRTSYFYDALGNKSIVFKEVWADSVWENSCLQRYNYDGVGNCTIHLIQQWEGTAWVNRRRHLFAYDFSGRVTMHAEFFFHERFWLNVQRDYWKYSLDGSLTEHLVQDGGGTDWEDSYRETFSYDENKHRTRILAEKWHDDAKEWRSASRYLYAWGQLITNVDDPGQAVFPFELMDNYPNPFNASTTIEFAVPHDGYVTLKVYNVLGEEVANLVEGDRAAGTFKATWNASGLTSGVYFYRLTAGEYVQTKKAVLMK